MSPLGFAEFAERLDRLARFEAEPWLAVAVSGGPDSLALTILADRWAQCCGGRITAVSVDHRLRPDSGAEIAKLGGWLAARSIPHEILIWRDPKPSSRLQEAARGARYRLLGEWCRQRGCLHLLTGHHRDDQIETHRLRRAARSGPDGLAGMSAIRELDGCRILRPLLDIPKSRLVATLEAEGQAFASDPSNQNPVFARTLLRRCALADPTATVADIRRCGRERVVREEARDALLARAVALHPAGFATIQLNALAAAAGGLVARALSRLVGTLAGKPYPPRSGSIARLQRALADPVFPGHVLGGYRFVPWRGSVLVLRELAAAAAPARIGPGVAILWDGRFAAALPARAQPLRMGYLGAAGAAELHRRAVFRGAPLPPIMHPILLGFWDEVGLAAVPSLWYWRDRGVRLPRLAFRPVNSLSHASFAVV